jgi:hypothetical protein
VRCFSDITEETGDKFFLLQQPDKNALHAFHVCSLRYLKNPLKPIRIIILFNFLDGPASPNLVRQNDITVLTDQLR